MSIPRSTATGQRAVWPFGWVTAATLVVNVLSYVLHVVATNSLGPAGYGQFAALLAVQVVATVPALALQTVVAREIVRGTDVAALRRVVRQLALILVGVAAVATVLLSIFFKQWPWWVTAAAFVAVPVLAGMSGELGIIQGSERFGRFGWALLGTGIGKFVPPTLVFVFLTRASTPSGTLSASEQVASHVVTAAFVALAAGCAVAWAGLRLWNRTTEATASTDPAVSSTVTSSSAADVRAVLWASQVQLLIMVFTQLDVVLVPRLLAPTEAGYYAAGAIFTKIAFWLPAAIVLVLYPQMARREQGGKAVRRAVVLLVAVGVVVVAGTALVAPWMPYVIGQRFQPVVPWLWLFALLGAVFSVLQALLVGEIAQASMRVRFRAGMLWPLVVVEAILLAVWGTSLLAVVLIALGCATAAVLLALVLRRYSA
ncbi:MAG TPA: oligosaccharide flippase family protein [Corynebacteriales bacterium]|nr:oligosaccharide flippase family protein [Mycobacteriales bacterium]